MKVNLKDSRYITMLVDTQKNIVIFPIGKSDFPVKMPDGSMLDFSYFPCNNPIELKFPYTVAELADKIKQGIEEWGKHKCYPDWNGKNTLEEKYYGIKGFKKAVKGNLSIDLGWDDISGKYVSLMMPTKRGYAYLGLDSTKLAKKADWIDYANAVMNYINMDVTTLDSYKVYREKLNV